MTFKADSTTQDFLVRASGQAAGIAGTLVFHGISFEHYVTDSGSVFRVAADVRLPFDLRAPGITALPEHVHFGRSSKDSRLQSPTLASVATPAVGATTPHDPIYDDATRHQRTRSQSPTVTPTPDKSLRRSEYHFLEHFRASPYRSQNPSPSLRIKHHLFRLIPRIRTSGTSSNASCGRQPHPCNHRNYRLLAVQWCS